MSREAWQAAFVAMSVVLGEPLDACLEALGPRAEGAPPPDLLDALRSPVREARARGIAGPMARIVAELDALGPT